MLLAAAGTAKKDELQRNAHATLQRLKNMLSGANDIQLSDVRIRARSMPHRFATAAAAACNPQSPSEGADA
jgi:hypothetical protein